MLLQKNVFFFFFTLLAHRLVDNLFLRVFWSLKKLFFVFVK